MTEELNDTARREIEEILGKNIKSVIVVPVIPHGYTVEIPAGTEVLTVRVSQECVKILLSGEINPPSS